MTTTVAQLIEWLKTQDQNKMVCVVREYDAGGYMGTATEMVDLELPDEWGYSDTIDVFDNQIWLGER